MEARLTEVRLKAELKNWRNSGSVSFAFLLDKYNKETRDEREEMMDSVDWDETGHTEQI